MHERSNANASFAAAAGASAVTIKRVDAFPVSIPLTHPLRLASRTISFVDNLVVRIEAQGGEVGWGEAASQPHITGETLGGMVIAVRDYLTPVLIGGDARMRPALCKTMAKALKGNGGVRSALEMALLDLLGQAFHVPAVDLLGGAMRKEVSPLWHLATATIEDDIAQAKAKQAEGYSFFKLKIGVKDVRSEIEAALNIRQAVGPDVKLGADGNAGLSLADARLYLEETRPAKLLFLEQPLPPQDILALASLNCTAPIGVSVDAASIGEIEQHLARETARGFSLKLAKSGGIADCADVARACTHRGAQVNISAKIAESSIASAAIAHLACALPEVNWGVSLTNVYLAEDLVTERLAIKDGAVRLSGRPGLGIEVDERQLARLTAKPV